MAAPAGGNPTVSRMALANTLRKLRRQAGKTLDEAAAELEVSAATVSRYEAGIRIPRARDVRDLCRFFGLTDDATIERLADLVAQARETGWWQEYSEVDDDTYSDYIGLESAATSIKEYSATLIPGLLQTPDYAKSFMSGAASLSRLSPYSNHDVDKLVEVRLRRQEMLHASTKLKYRVILDEAALRRPVGGRDVMRRQLLHLLDIGRLDWVEMQVLPFAAGEHPGQMGSFLILHVPTEAVSDIVFIDSLAGQYMIDSSDELQRYEGVYDKITSLTISGSDAMRLLNSLAQG